MTNASEKLRANWTRLDVDRQVDAWHAIIAVVEAAERSAQFEAGLGHYPICSESLATLSQALEPGKETP